MLTAILTVFGYLVGSMPWGYWLVRDLPRRGHPDQGQRQHRRDERLARLRPAARAGGRAPRHAEGIRAGVPRDDSSSGTASGVLAGAAAMLGHYRPLFLGFRKGGKMVATAGGAFLGVAPLVGGVAAAVWIVVFLADAVRVRRIDRRPRSRSPLWAWLLGYPWPVIALGAFAGIGVLVLHSANLGRLWRGEENRSTLWRAGGARVRALRPVSEVQIDIINL